MILWLLVIGIVAYAVGQLTHLAMLGVARLIMHFFPKPKAALSFAEFRREASPVFSQLPD